jgi:hypothetical protein
MKRVVWNALLTFILLGAVCVAMLAQQLLVAGSWAEFKARWRVVDVRAKAKANVERLENNTAAPNK